MNAAGWRTHAIGGVALVGVIAGGVVVGVLPELDRNEVQRELNEERARLLADRDVALQEQRAMREELVAVQDLGAGWAAQRDQRGTLNAGMARLASIATERGVRLDSLSAGDASRTQLFDVTPIEADGVGAFEACALFMSDVIERMPNVTIDSFELRGDARTGDGGFSMRLAWFSDSAEGAD